MLIVFMLIVFMLIVFMLMMVSIIAAGDLRLYSDRHGLWMLGCADEEEDERGFMTSKHMHEWQIFRDGEWRDDATIKVSLPPDAGWSQFGPTRTELHRSGVNAEGQKAGA
eukprot:gene17093-59227_t